MKYDEFIGQVQNRARIPTREEAVKAIRATLETLAERLAGGEPNDLAAQLPEEIGVYLKHERAGAGERFSLDEFFQRVSEREGVDLPVSVYHTRVVIEILQEAVSTGQINDVLAQLPEEFNRLFEAGSEGKMPPERR
jgi:uncharacterized protein (DUF2267 family)